MGTDRTLPRALEDAKRELDLAVAALEGCQAALTLQQQKVHELHTEVQGLQMAMARADQPESDDGSSWWSKFLIGISLVVTESQTRTTAIVDVLAQADRPLSPSEIVEALHHAGRSDTIHSVSATITYLTRQR